MGIEQHKQCRHINSKSGRHVGPHKKVVWPTALFLKSEHVFIQHFAGWPTGQHNAIT